MNKQQRLRQAEQNNIHQAFIDYDAKLQQAFANAKNPKPIDWFRTPNGWSISRDRSNSQNSSDNPGTAS